MIHSAIPQFRLVLMDLGKWGPDNMCEYSDHYRLWLWAVELNLSKYFISTGLKIN